LEIAIMMRILLPAALALLVWPVAQAEANGTSRCIAFVERAPRILPAAFDPAQSPALGSDEVEIEFVTHSTFRLRTPAGVVAATDYAGYAGDGPTPDIATMNHAHDSHYTDFPDPAIAHVLRGWNPAGGPAKHHLHVKDLMVRNVSTDIRGWSSTVEPDGNSIFIYEVADLCIGHLGHLHHKPTPEQLARIGRLDVVFAAVDGTYTLDIPTMIEVLKELRASLVIPMHFFGGESLNLFVAGMSTDFAVRINEDPTAVVSLATLPRRPTVLVLPGY
jgi:L-ascorbate metabolism protein UlaG (beta-lactamase superfamily)